MLVLCCDFCKKEKANKKREGTDLRTRRDEGPIPRDLREGKKKKKKETCREMARVPGPCPASAYVSEKVKKKREKRDKEREGDVKNESKGEEKKGEKVCVCVCCVSLYSIVQAVKCIFAFNNEDKKNFNIDHHNR